MADGLPAYGLRRRPRQPLPARIRVPTRAWWRLPRAPGELVVHGLCYRRPSRLAASVHACTLTLTRD